MIRVGILTSSRADFGIYIPLITKLKNDKEFEIKIIAFGTHLSSFHGHTIDQITEAGFEVEYKIESMLLTDSPSSIATSMGLTTIKFADFWKEHANEFDLVFCLGDRYEMVSAVMAGVPFQIKFAHLHGGETTLGAIDNVFRHAITHASAVHFTSTKSYFERVKQMIGQSEHVYYTGALSLDNLTTIPLLSINQFKQKWGVDLGKATVLTTFHPETINSDLNIQHANELVKAIKSANGYQFLITMPNSDTSGNTVRRIFETELSNQSNVFLIENLGTQSYFTAMKYCSLLLGNTSSGIIEAASFGKYVINLGNRQDGRVCGDNVIQTAITEGAIKSAISTIALNKSYNGANIYYRSGAADTIINVLKTDFFHV
jgi:GDP/UDP-N,N'-diacetylbacillosamine 2-epimerase (hydrolysing)